MIPLGVLASQQSAPAAWSPADEGGLLAWYDATTLTASDTDTIGSWPDLSGNSRTLQNTYGTTHYPTYRTGITPNGQPVVRFDGVDNFLYTSSKFTIPAEFSLFWFGSLGSQTGDYRPMCHGEQSYAGGWHWDRYYAGTIRPLFSRVWGLAQSAVSGFQAYGFIVDLSATPKATWAKDNTDIDTYSAADMRRANTDYLSVGGLAGTHYAIVDVCEILYFDHVVDSTTRANVQTYFDTKYG